MNQNYTQTLQVAITKNSKTKQYAGFALLLLSGVFLIVSVFVSWFCMIAFAISFVASMVLLQLYNDVAKEFVYDFSSERIVITKRTLINRYKRVIDISHKDVEYMQKANNFHDKSIIACSANVDEAFEIVFKSGDNTHSLFITPDDYILALLRQKYGNKCQWDNF